jgi:hypothetical protein
MCVTRPCAEGSGKLGARVLKMAGQIRVAREHCRQGRLYMAAFRSL